MTTIEKIEEKADKEHEEAKEELRQWKEVWGVRLNYLKQNRKVLDEDEKREKEELEKELEELKKEKKERLSHIEYLQKKVVEGNEQIA